MGEWKFMQIRLFLHLNLKNFLLKPNLLTLLLIPKKPNIPTKMLEAKKPIIPPKASNRLHPLTNKGTEFSFVNPNFSFGS